MNDESLLFLEETLEFFLSIHANLIELSENHSPDVIVQSIAIVDRLAQDANRHNLIEIQASIEQLKILITSASATQTRTLKPNLIKQLWQTYTNLKQFLMRKLSQSSSGMAGILAQGESLVASIPPLIKVSDLDLFQEIWDKDLTPILNYLETALNHSDRQQLSPIFNQQAEILIGLGELLEIPDLIIITQMAIALQQNHPQATHSIVKRTLACWRTAQTTYFQLFTSNLQSREEAPQFFNQPQTPKPTETTAIFPVTANQVEQAKNSEIISINPSQTPNQPNLKTNNYFLWLANTNLFLIKAEQIQAIVNPLTEQFIYSNNQLFFPWQEQIIPCYQLSQLIEYNYPIAKLFPDSNFTSSQSQILILNHERKIIALAIEVEQLLVIPELTLQHFNPILPTPKYLLGCTVLEDERLVVVIDVLTLLKNKFYLI